jgi:signal transduction histidine kinase
MQDIIKILLVEDNPADAKWVDIQLRKIFAGTYTLTTADYLKKAVELSQNNTFDIIILDLSLPDSDGFDSLNKMLENPSACPVIVLTGITDESVGVTAVKLGAQDYLIKGKASSNSLKRSIIYSLERNALSKKLSESIKTIEVAKAKQQFFAGLSHEIRTPLNGILGFTKLLLRDENTPKQKKYLEAIKDSGDILLVVINDILNFSKIEAGKINIEETELELVELMDITIDNFELRLAEKGVRVNKKYDPFIPKVLMGDPIRITQIFFNLLSNAVKFNHEAGQISVTINLLKEDEKTANLEFIISDSGIGIPAEKLETIFEPFTQSTADITRKYGGTGLGLTIAVKSQLNAGSTFTLNFPLKKSTKIQDHPQEKASALVNEHKLGKLKILLVEDSAINTLLAEEILRDFGFQTDTAKNGKIAIELLEKNDYDVILMDLSMPEMDGFEATQYIRNNMPAPKSQIPIIALTSGVDKQDMEKCVAYGMNDYLLKPFDENHLLNTIAHSIKKKG